MTKQKYHEKYDFQAHLSKKSQKKTDHHFPWIYVRVIQPLRNYNICYNNYNNYNYNIQFYYN